MSQTKTNSFQVNLKQIPGWGDNTNISFDWIAFGTLKEPETSPEAKAEWENAMEEREERRRKIEQKR